MKFHMETFKKIEENKVNDVYNFFVGPDLFIKQANGQKVYQGLVENVLKTDTQPFDAERLDQSRKLSELTPSPFRPEGLKVHIS